MKAYLSKPSAHLFNQLHWKSHEGKNVPRKRVSSLAKEKGTLSTLARGSATFAVIQLYTDGRI